MTSTSFSSTPRRVCAPGRTPRRVLTWTLLASAWVSIWPVAVSRASPGTPPLPAQALKAPRFFVEAIEVRGSRAPSSALVVAESLLVAGQSYSEDELREAVARVERLPFILSSDVALGRGSQRGRHVLYIDVRETRRFFYEVDLVGGFFSDPLALGAEATVDDDGGAALVLGARAFLGRYSMVFAGLSDSSVQAGFTHYNLFDRHLFLNVAVSRETCCAVDVVPLGLDPALSSWISSGDGAHASLTIGRPLDVHQTLKGSLRFGRSEEGLRRPFLGRRGLFERFDYEDLEQLELEGSWRYDTTDDLVFPRRGTELVATVGFSSLAAELSAFVPFASPGSEADVSPSPLRSDAVELGALLRRHWPLDGRQTLSGGVSLAAGRGDVAGLPGAAAGRRRFDTWKLELSLKHALSVLRAKPSGRFRRLRWQNSLELTRGGTSLVLDGRADELETLSFRTELVFQNAWGLTRFGIRVVGVGGGP